MLTTSTSTLNLKNSRSRGTSSRGSGRRCGNSCVIRSCTRKQPRNSGTNCRDPMWRSGIWMRINGRSCPMRDGDLPSSEICLRLQQTMKTNTSSIQSATNESSLITPAAERHAVCRKGTFYLLGFLYYTYVEGTILRPDPNLLQE